MRGERANKLNKKWFVKDRLCHKFESKFKRDLFWGEKKSQKHKGFPNWT